MSVIVQTATKPAPSIPFSYSYFPFINSAYLFYRYTTENTTTFCRSKDRNIGHLVMVSITTSLVLCPRATARFFPSGDQANEKMRPEVNDETCLVVFVE